ncbi:putative signal transducing protein [Winogradskyella sp. PE311]|uniref:putative signal transducing protein n=1 Tax=Winogradskyella sp. PE311 TaxID=3366943 RepID=UPI00397EF45F
MSQTFITIARFQYSSEAQIVKGRLEADGIEVFLRDNITIDTDPLVSNAIGGVKLKVLTKDTKKAKEILKAIKIHSLDDNGKPILCPNCGNDEVELYSSIDSLKSFLSFLIGILTFTLPFHTRYKYVCINCKTEFPIK